MRVPFWLVAMSIALRVPAATAQTLLAPPDTNVDVGKYTTIEECVAATARVEEALYRRERLGVWRDTLPWNPKEALEPLPEPLVSTAQRCSARFQAATVQLSDLRLVVPLFLLGNRDKDVATLATRRLAAIGAHGTTKSAAPAVVSTEVERLAVLDSVFQWYLSARPARISSADSLVTALDRSTPRPMRAKPAAKLMQMYLALGLKAQTLQDTIVTRARAMRAIALLDSLTPSERQAVRETEFGTSQSFESFAYAANLARAGYGVMLDSLRKSTAAFVALQASLWTEATGESPEAAGFPIGRKAPQLVGAQSSGAGTSVPRPVAGKVNLVLFVDQMCTDVMVLPNQHLNDPSECRPVAASLRRMAARDPSLEITLVDRTRGSFMYLAPPTPEEEVVQINKDLAAHQVPGTSMIGTTQFFRIAAPDRRRIATKQLPNFNAYTFGKSWPSDGGAAFIIDQDGIVVLPTGALTRDYEQFFGDLIAVMESRGKTSTAAAGSPR